MSVTYNQKFTKVSTECVIDSRKTLAFLPYAYVISLITYVQYAYLVPEGNVRSHLGFRLASPPKYATDPTFVTPDWVARCSARWHHVLFAGMIKVAPVSLSVCLSVTC